MEFLFEGGNSAAMAAGWARALTVPGTKVAGPVPDQVTVAAMAEVGADLREPFDALGPEARVITVPEAAGDPTAVCEVARAQVEALADEQGIRVRYGDAVRGAFGIDHDITFLNHGSYGAAPRSVLAAQRHWTDELEAQPIEFFRVLPGRVRAAAARVAPILRADPQDVVFVDNATTGLSGVLHSFRWQPGDVIVTTDHAYHAVQGALRQLAHLHGVVLRFAEVPFPIADPADAVRAIEPLLRGARLAVVDHITSITGLVFPIAEVAAACRRHGVPLFVDAAHAPGQVVLDVPAIGADWWVGNAHKWLFAPKGCAVLHVRRDRHTTTHPAVWSLGTGEGLHMEFDFVGTRDPSAWLAVGAALDAVDTFGGLDRIRTYDGLLRRAATEVLLAALGSRNPAPEGMRAALATLPLPDRPAFRGGSWTEARALNLRLWEEHRIEAMIVPWQGRLWLRISPQIYNRIEEYERLAEVLSGL